MLTDEELRDICLEYRGDNERCRAIEAKIEAKLREQNERIQSKLESYERDFLLVRKALCGDIHNQENLLDLVESLRKHPAPIPEGYALVPIEPPDSMLVYVVGFSSKFANANQFSDTRRSNYKAMLAAARSE